MNQRPVYLPYATFLAWLAGISLSNAPVIYTTDPNVEGLTPADITKSCVAYSSNGEGAIYGWDIVGHTWK